MNAWQELDGSITVIANSFQGRQLNRPNDVVVKSDGCILLHRPVDQSRRPRAVGPDLFGRVSRHPRSRHYESAYQRFHRAERPAFSPDESVLYVNDPRRGHIRAFDLMPNGTVAKQTDRVFVDLAAASPVFPTG